MRWFNVNRITLYFDNTPYSPDPNPTKYIPVNMMFKLHVIYPDIATRAGESEIINARIVEILPDICDEIEESVFESMIDLMPQRVKAVMDANG